MRFHRIKKCILSLFFCFLLAVSAQAQAIWEAGIKAGTNFYLGDRNSVLFDDVNPVFGAFVKVNANSRWATKVQFETGSIKTDFQQQYVDFSLQQEFSFFEYGLLNSAKWTRFFSPYILCGVGLAFFNEGNRAVFAPNIPFGFGVKYKVVDKVNIGLEWSMLKLFSDSFDQLSNPYNNNESIWLNKDWISMATFFVSVDVGNKSSYCR